MVYIFSALNIKYKCMQHTSFTTEPPDQLFRSSSPQGQETWYAKIGFWVFELETRSSHTQVSVKIPSSWKPLGASNTTLNLDLRSSSRVYTYIKITQLGIWDLYTWLYVSYTAIKKIKCFLITTCEVGPEVIILSSTQLHFSDQATKTPGKLERPRPLDENNCLSFASSSQAWG